MNEFVPYQYQPRFAGPSQPIAASAGQGGGQGQNPSLGDLFERVGTVGQVSKSINLSSFLDPISLETAGSTVFLMFPGDIALQRAILAWNKTSTDTGGGNTTFDITIQQYQTFNTSGLTAIDVFPNLVATEARFGQAAILNPVAQVEPYTPLVATIRCLNSADPAITAFFEDSDLELWLTIHFLAGTSA